MQQDVQVDAAQDTLNLSNQGVEDLDIHTDLPNVTALSLSNNPIRSVAFLYRFLHLKLLHIDSCGIDDAFLQPLSRCHSIVCLIARNNKIQQLQPFCPGLKHLDLSCNSLRSINSGNAAQKTKTLIFGDERGSALRPFDIFTRFYSLGCQYVAGNQLSDLLVCYKNLPEEERLIINFSSSNPSKTEAITITLYLYVANAEVRVLNEGQYVFDDEIMLQYQFFGIKGATTRYPTDDAHTDPRILRFQQYHSQLCSDTNNRFGVIQISYQRMTSFRILNLTEKTVTGIAEAQYRGPAEVNILHKYSMQTINYNNLYQRQLANSTAPQQLHFNIPNASAGNRLLVKNCPASGDVYMVNYFQTRHTVDRLMSGLCQLIINYNAKLCEVNVFETLQQAIQQLEKHTYQQFVSNGKIANQAHPGMQNNIYSDSATGGDFMRLYITLPSGKIVHYDVGLHRVHRGTRNVAVEVPQSSVGRLLVAQVWRAVSAFDQLVVSEQQVGAEAVADQIQIVFDSANGAIYYNLFCGTQRVQSQRYTFKLYKDNILALQSPRAYVDLAVELSSEYDGTLYVVADDITGRGPPLRSAEIVVKWQGHFRPGRRAGRSRPSSNLATQPVQQAPEPAKPVGTKTGPAAKKQGKKKAARKAQ